MHKMLLLLIKSLLMALFEVRDLDDKHFNDQKSSFLLYRLQPNANEPFICLINLLIQQEFFSIPQGHIHLQILHN